MKPQLSRAEKIKRCISSAVDEINATLPKKHQLQKTPQTILFGKSGKLDSLGLINLIVATEQSINQEFSATISLADDRAMARKKNPFRSIKSLTDYVSTLLEQTNNA